MRAPLYGWVVFAVTGSVFYSSQANYVVILTVEISSTCVNNVEHHKLGVLIATYFPPFYLDVSVSSICLVCVYGARSPGLQRTGKLRACGQNAVYSISGPAAREKKWKVAISPAFWWSWHHWGALEQDSFTPSYLHTCWLSPRRANIDGRVSPRLECS